MKKKIKRKQLLTSLEVSNPCLLLVALACVGSGVAFADVTDGFDDGNRTSTTDGIDWYTHSHPQMNSGGSTLLGISIVDDSAGLGSGNALRVEPITTGQSIMGVFGSPLSVPAGIGSTLTLQFEIRNDNSGAAPGGTFRFGLYDADEGTFPDPAGFGGTDGDPGGDGWDAAQPGSQFDRGVLVQQDNTGGASNGAFTRLREETGTDGSTQHGGGDVFGVAAPVGAFPELDGADGKNTLTLEIERLSAGTAPGSLLYTYTIDNGTTVDTLSGANVSLGAVNASDAYDYVSLFYDGNNQWLIDNLSVRTVAIPEPASWSLISIAALGLLWFRRRN